LYFTSDTFIYFFFYISPWISEPVNGLSILRTAGGMVIPSLDSSPRPPVLEEKREIAPNFAQKCHGALIRRVVVAKRRNIYENGKHSFERWIIALHFGENYASLPLPNSEKAWRTRCTSFSPERRYRFTIVRQMAPLRSGRTAAIENDGIAAI